MLLAVSPEVIAQAAVNILAVGGAFLVGQWLTAAAFWAFTPNTAPGLKRLGRLLGGTALAILVAVIVFGHGQGWTLFGGGGAGLSKGNGPTEQKGEGSGPTAVTPVTATVPTPTTTPAEVGEKVRITVLGGTDVRDERFYRIDADLTARTFAELIAALDARRAIGKKFHMELMFTTDNTLPRDHPAVTRLTSWAHAHKLTVSFPAP